MNLYSYIKKAKNLFWLNCLKRNGFILPNLYLSNINISELKTVKKILFFFADEEYMHLGDHLFFIPLIQVFMTAGFVVEVAPTRVMQPLLQNLGFTIFNIRQSLSDYDLIISRIEMIDLFPTHRALLVNVSKNLSMPICDQLLNDFGKFFYLPEYKKIDYMMFYFGDILDKLKLPKNKKIVLFSLFCDASAFMVNKTKVNYLLRFAREYAEKNDCILVLVGTTQDKIAQPIDCEYIDLRGKTTVLDIFSLVGSNNVICYIGFDAFVMHVFSLFCKSSFVVFRGRLFKHKHEMLKKYHVNLFCTDNYVHLLDVK